MSFASACDADRGGVACVMAARGRVEKADFAEAKLLLPRWIHLVEHFCEPTSCAESVPAHLPYLHTVVQDPKVLKVTKMLRLFPT